MSFRNRKGAMALMVALMLMLLLTFLAYAIDFSKIFVMRDELHTSADAGSLAAAVNWQQTKDSTAAKAAGAAFVPNNRVLNAPPAVDSVVAGNWDEAAGTFTSTGAGGTPVNAFQVWTRQPTNYLFGGVSKMTPRQIRAAATAWAEAPVSETDCVTPWAIPYDSLTRKIDSLANPFRDLTQEEIDDFLARPEAERTVTLKAGSPNTPGNFFPIDFPPYWRASDGTYGNPDPGGAAYRDLLKPCDQLTPAEQAKSRSGAGDSLQVEPGNKQGPTMQGAPGLIGYKITIPLFTGYPAGRANTVVVKILAGFTVTDVSQPNKTVTGYFTELARTGRIGTGPSLVKAAILVQ